MRADRKAILFSFVSCPQDRRALTAGTLQRGCHTWQGGKSEAGNEEMGERDLRSNIMAHETRGPTQGCNLSWSCTMSLGGHWASNRKEIINFI